jgi:hypothetical protein
MRDGIATERESPDFASLNPGYLRSLYPIGADHIVQR